jgi:hypothetical protein
VPAARAVQRLVACEVVAFLLGAACSAQEQYPKPLIHTPANHPAERVVLLEVGGLNAVDLAMWVKSHPDSAMAELSRRGVTYTNAHVPWTDEAAGLVALVTGGTPVSTGIVSADGYDRALSPAGSACRTMGTALLLDMDAVKMPLDPKHSCSSVAPHALLYVNNIFEVMNEKGARTAWAGTSAALTDLYAGPSGSGLSEACGWAAPEKGDQMRVAAVLHWIDGKDCGGKLDSPVPVVMGISFSAVGETKMMTADNGYADATGTPAKELTRALKSVDDSIAAIVHELKTKKLFDSTWIVVTASYGRAPVTTSSIQSVNLSNLKAVVESVPHAVVSHISASGSAMVWLKDPSVIAPVTNALSAKASALGIEEVVTGERLGLTMSLPAEDSRIPDIILRSRSDVRWVPAGRGSSTDEDAHVALLVSGMQLTGRLDKTPVPTTQLPPLLLRALGMEKFDLQALHREHSPALPGIF